jgi:hypothetical protein
MQTSGFVLAPLAMRCRRSYRRPVMLRIISCFGLFCFASCMGLACSPFCSARHSKKSRISHVYPELQSAGCIYAACMRFARLYIALHTCGICMEDACQASCPPLDPTFGSWTPGVANGGERAERLLRKLVGEQHRSARVMVGEKKPR